MLCRIALENFNEHHLIVSNKAKLSCKRKNLFGESFLDCSPILNATPSSITELMRNEIDDSFKALNYESPASLKCAKKRNLRPDNWRVIVDHYLNHGFNDTISVFEGALSRYNKKLPAIKKNLKVWEKEKDFSDDFLKTKKKRRMPLYGRDIDIELCKVIERMGDSGLPVDNSILRRQLLCLLENHNKLNLVLNDASFGNSWAERFWARHNLSSRAPTTKMRELPLDFDEKLEDYICIGAEIICRHNIPPPLTPYLSQHLS